MKFVFSILLFFYSFILVFSQNKINVIPYPTKVEFRDRTFVYESFGIEAPLDLLNQFTIKGLKKYNKHIHDSNEKADGARPVRSEDLQIEFIVDKSLGEEEYKIDINWRGVNVFASTTIGFQYAYLTLDQIIPSTVEGTIQSMTIHDKPSFSYRGMHLDVSRHFFNVAEVKKYIDYLAQYKYNRFHWHLTDDQGWRIEIKKYPKLTEIGGYRKETLIGHYNDQPHQFDEKRYGGFYTQEQIKEVVAYATERSITVIPEIEMPGHALAALAAYPELGCGKSNYEVATKWGVFDDVFCPNEATFEFLQNVLDEVVALFPSKYIHIGGDECPKDAWKKSAFCQQLIKDQKLKDEHELQAYFIKRIGKYLNEKHSRTIIGWDEILEGNLTSGSDTSEKPVIMSWRGIDGGIASAKAQHKAIMTPGSHCYFDHYQSQKPTEPTAIGGYTDVKKVYGWEVVPTELKGAERQYIIGGQANVWTEYIPTFAQVEYMAYARGLAMSEVLWGTNNNYTDFLRRYDINYDMLKSKNINIANHIYELKPKISSGKGEMPKVSFELPIVSAIKHHINENVESVSLSDHTFDLSKPGKHSFSLENRPEESANINVEANVATRAKISITPLPSDKYNGNGEGSIINGVLGSSKKYGGTEWLGFEGGSPVIDLDLGSVLKVNSLEMRFFKGEGQWIYLPQGFEIWTSKDGIKYKKAKNKIGSNVLENTEVKLLPLNIKCRYVRIHVKNYGVIPDGKQGGGHSSWLFMDEIVIK